MPTPIALVSAGGGAVPAKAGQNGARPTLERAALELYEPKPVPGGSSRGAPLGRIPFQFNPKELTISKAAKWERKPARGAKTAGPPEFKGSDPCKLTLEMFFDATDTLDAHVVERVEALLRCCVPTEASAGQKKEIPPIVVLQWGKVTSFHAFVTSVQAKFTLFTPDGTPIRATCSVSLEEMPGEPPRQNPTSGSHTARATHTVLAGDTLASIAYAEYGDPRLWRALAAFNGIDDPLRVALGATVLVPAADELPGA